MLRMPLTVQNTTTTETKQPATNVHYEFLKKINVDDIWCHNLSYQPPLKISFRPSTHPSTCTNMCCVHQRAGQAQHQPHLDRKNILNYCFAYRQRLLFLLQLESSGYQEGKMTLAEASHTVIHSLWVLDRTTETTEEVAKINLLPPLSTSSPLPLIFIASQTR